MGGWQWLVIAAVLALGQRPAVARQTDQREFEAQKACLTGNYQRGIELLAELFIATDDANYLYNQGRCYQQNARFDEAISRFREYLRKVKNATDAERADAQAQIDECQRLRASPAVPRPTITSIGRPLEHRPSPQLAAVVSRDDGRRSRRIGGTFIVIGVVALAGAVVAGLGVQSLEKDVMAQFNPSKNTWGPRLETLEFAGYGVGALGLGAGTAFYLSGARSRGTALVPRFSRTEAGFLWSRRF